MLPAVTVFGTGILSCGSSLHVSPHMLFLFRFQLFRRFGRGMQRRGGWNDVSSWIPPLRDTLIKFCASK